MHIYYGKASSHATTIRVILNGQIWGRRGQGGGASLKFEKDDSLAKCASGAPKSIADKKVRTLTQGGT